MAKKRDGYRYSDTYFRGRAERAFDPGMDPDDLETIERLSDLCPDCGAESDSDHRWVGGESVEWCFCTECGREWEAGA